ncbi:MAG: PEP-CTERM sorting domain-containing protein [Chthoniobacterales bacterium]|nr:PEP-CTERM sorting domain-containing protein [Chthoniobacterales bacterium]
MFSLIARRIKRFGDHLGKKERDNVSFNGFTGYGLADFGTYYEVYALTPVPEPSTWAAAALALGVIVWTQRRRFARRTVLMPVA